MTQDSPEREAIDPMREVLGTMLVALSAVRDCVANLGDRVAALEEAERNRASYEREMVERRI